APDDLLFPSFTVAQASVDLGTVRQLVPGMALNGILDAVGTVTGPLHNAEFSGVLMYHDGGRPASVLTGTVRLDNRADTLGVYAEVRAESLSFDGLRGSFPGLPLRGAVAGR